MRAKTVDIQKKPDTKNTLLSLRKKLREGQINTSQYVLDAAEAYLDNRLLLRAMTLLKSLMSTDSLTTEQSFQYYQVKNRILTTPPLPFQSCSLNMIVKNEEQNIPDALDSVDTIMDEIVICDTGSSDNTAYLAEQYGVTIIHDPWQNDFSRARNTAIDASTCDWIFWMDADDRLEDSSADALQKLWQNGKSQGAAFCIINERDHAAPVEFIQVRLFPRQQGICFEQRIHEQIMFCLSHKDIPFTRHPEICIRHTGYLNQETHRKKAERNKPLLCEEIKENPDDPTLQLSLADCLMTLGEIEEAGKLYRAVTQNNTAWEINSDVFVQAHVNYAKHFIRHKDTHNAKRYFLRSLYLDNTRIEAYYALGRLFLDDGDDKKAAQFFMYSARITPPLRMTAVDNLVVRLESIYYLMESLITWKRYSEAEKTLIKAIECYPMVPQFYNQLGRVLLLQSKMTKAAFYFTMSTHVSTTNNDGAYQGLAEIYTLLGDPKTAEQFLHKAGT